MFEEGRTATLLQKELRVGDASQFTIDQAAALTIEGC